jgi:nitrilase
MTDSLTIGFAQIAPVWLDRERTLEKVLHWAGEAGRQGCQLLAFGEALVPGYPFWVELTDGARFNDAVQKDLFAHYARHAVQIETGHLDGLRAVAARHGMAIYLGCIERPADRGGHSLYASLVYIDPQGQVGSVHRKLMPTYEERLVWSAGDGHGLRVHRLGAFTVGGLNCWENWMPLPRAALYAQGEDLHVAVWPGSLRNTGDITRFIAREGRSYVLSVSGLLRSADILEHVPHAGQIRAAGREVLANGGSCLAGPDGEWLIEPLEGEEGLRLAQVEHSRVLQERHNFDPAGHYARPDVTRLLVNRERQSTLKLVEE